MEIRDRRKIFATRSFSQAAISMNDLSITKHQDIKSDKQKPPVPSSWNSGELSTSVSEYPIFRKKLSRTDSSIIVVSRCAGSSSPSAPKTVFPKKNPKPVRQNSVSSFFHKHLNHIQQRLTVSKSDVKSPSRDKLDRLEKFSSSSKTPTAKPPPVPICLKYGSPKSGRKSPTDVARSRLNSPLTSPNLLGVPNIFTTAFSHSARAGAGADVSPEDIRLTEQAANGFHIKRGYSKSTPELQDASIENSQGDQLDVPRRERRQSDDKGCLQITSLLQSNKYKDIYVCEILEYLYLGSIEAAYNEPLLCKLGIDSLIDISNVLPEKVPPQKKSDCPCMCMSRTRHLRAKLYVSVDDEVSENIQQYFAEINSFIDGVRRCGKRVLVYSYYGNSRAPTAVIQHLMVQKNLLLRQSFNLVKNQRPSIKINPGFRCTLEDLERRLFPSAKHSVSFENEFVNIANPQLVKTAWADC